MVQCDPVLEAEVIFEGVSSVQFVYLALEEGVVPHLFNHEPRPGPCRNRDVLVLASGGGFGRADDLYSREAVVCCH